LRLEPLLEVFLEVPPLEGFELEIQWGDRWLGDTDIGDQHVDKAYFIRTNDEELAKVWLDEEARLALSLQRDRIDQRNFLESQRFSLLQRLDAFGPADAQTFHAWPLVMKGRELVVTRGSHFVPAAELVEAVDVACVIAGGAGRWAARVAAMAELTGARVRNVVDRIALGERAVLLEQQRADVDVRYLREDGRLMTKVSTLRINESETTWTARRGKKLPVPDPALAALFAHEAGPELVIASATDVAVWFRGAALDPEPIALATRLVAQLASDAGIPEGPYR
jgi:hypothetical protein